MPLPPLTRKALYELVWSEPATKLAKQLEVSDVWISKVCKKANIPKPPQGYWQALAAGKKVNRAALPNPLPLQPDNMALLGESWNRKNYPVPQWEPPITDDEPIAPVPPPHLFSETIEEVKIRAQRLTEPLAFQESLKHPHPATLRLLQGDIRRGSKPSYFVMSWETPRYRHPSGLALLTALNRLFTAWTTLGATVSISGAKHQSISVNVLGSNLPLCFIDYQWEGTRARPKNKSLSKYGFSWDYLPRDEIYDQRTHKTYREYEEFSVDILRALIAESIVHVEEQIRRNAASAYDGLIERREEAIRLREVRRVASIRRHEKAVQQLAEKRIQLMDDASSRIAHTDRLRSLISALDAEVHAARRPVEGYENWRSWATHHADLIDPRHMSPGHIEQWIAKFHLHQ